MKDPRAAAAAASATALISLPPLAAGAGSLQADDPSPPNHPPRDPLVASSPKDSCEGECAYWRHKAARRLQIAGGLERQRNRLRRAMRARVQLRGSNGVIAGLLCIHGHEGSWTDSGAPFWGGLQMDLNFQRAYGGTFYRALGTADHWPAALQLAVGAEAFYSGRGFGPWPTTRRLCGL